MKRIIMIAITAIAPITQAATCGLHVHAAALHSEPGFESMTPGLGVVCDTRIEDVRVAAGAFRNSIRKNSVYAGAAWQPLRLGPAHVGVFGGAITGYNRGVMPMAAGIVSMYLTPRTQFHMIIIPTVKGLTPATLALSVKYRL